jgi:hypothetical protein
MVTIPLSDEWGLTTIVSTDPPPLRVVFEGRNKKRSQAEA